MSIEFFDDDIDSGYLFVSVTNMQMQVVLSMDSTKPLHWKILMQGLYGVIYPLFFDPYHEITK